MEHNLENAVKVLNAMIENRRALWHDEESKGRKDGSYAKRQLHQAMAYEDAVAILTNEDRFNQLADIYEVAG